MTDPHPRENIKVCPGCGTNLINTAKHCAVCGYRFTDIDPLPSQVEDHPRRQTSQRVERRGMIALNLPVLFGLIILLVGINILVILGLQKRDQTKTLVDSERATATYIATTYVSPTPSPTVTFTPAPPTETPVVDIEYTVVSGDSCLSIAKHFNLYLDSLLSKNDIDCSTLNIGTVLRIPHPTATPEPTGTTEGAAAP